MKKGYVTYRPEGRLGNALFQASAAMAYAWDHGLEFSMPTTSRSDKWAPVYCQRLAKPDFDPTLTTVEVQEIGYRFQQLPWREHWREGHNIVLNGFFQSEKFWRHHRDRVLEAFGFPWQLNEGWVAVHVRRGDYLKHTDKHPEVKAEWYEAQMDKFPGYSFQFYSDDIDWCRKTFQDHPRCHFDQAVYSDLPDKRTEVVDLVSASDCEHVIGSASTFAVWMGLLGRNPNRRVIIPKQWICEGWQGTTSEDWADVVPTTKWWERA